MEIPYTFLLLMVSVPTLAFNDEFMSCDIYLESKRTARVLDHIPCDMSKKSFCEHKGAAYPEAAIWRFKEENRALMKRLYGDMDSTTVYREMRGFSMNIITDHGMFPNHEYNIRVGSGLATVQSAREAIEPSERSQPKMKRKVIKRKKVATSSDQASSPSEDVKVITSTTSSSSSVRVSTSASPPTATPPTMATPTTVDGIYPMTATEAAITYTTNAANTDETTLSLDETRLPETVSPPEAEVTTETPNDKETQPDVSPNPYTAQEYTVQDYTNPDFTVQDFTSEFLAEVDVQELEQIVGQILPDKQPNDSQPSNPSHQEAADQHYHQYQDYSAHDYEEVEYEDIYDDDQYEQKIEYTGTSVNACPVKEEVFAPYWANNTRDQVLALLNLYPFEQYIHMETCKFENEEIMCRPGCRCEQQFRLHRLLAFDPNNECRGIFSDWFRFPSYCICKCYNMNEELFLRNPRKEVQNEESRLEPKIEPKVEVKAEEEGNGLDENHRETKEAKFRSIPHPPLIQNIPAFLPYEAKQALLHAMNNPSTTTVVGKTEEMKSDEKEEEAKKRSRENRGDDSFDQHFFYGNEPILHYKLADNSEGTVRKTPRR